jgi:hypothetical protein
MRFLKLESILCLLLFVCSFCFSQNNKDNWHLYKSEDGISIYSRLIDGSSYKEIKSVFTVKTSLSSILALIYDWDSYPQWNYRCGESKTLKKISDTELIHYQTTDIPWPAKDQDFVIDIKLEQDEKTRVVLIRSTNMPTYIPPYEGRTRITDLKALWTLTPLKDGSIQLVYEFQVKPGTYVPTWLVNAAVLSGPYETMSNFREWLKKEKYQKAKNTLIKELND